jgi:hypothetical protein
MIPNEGFALSGLKATDRRLSRRRGKAWPRMMKSLGQQLNGQVQLAYEPSGFIYSLDVPLGSVAAAA